MEPGGTSTQLFISNKWSQAHDAVEIFIQHHSSAYVFGLLINLILGLVLLMFLWKTFTLHLAYCTAASRKTFENLQDMYRTIQHPLGHRKSKRVQEKHLLHWLHQSLWLCGSQQNGKFLERWEYQTTWPASWEICIQVKKQQLELDMEP